MKVSEITLDELREYCGISGNDSDSLLEIYRVATIELIKSYTGLTIEQIDSHEDITIAELCIVNDMYTNRDYIVDKTALNPIATQILAQHSVNYL